MPRLYYMSPTTAPLAVSSTSGTHESKEGARLELRMIDTIEGRQNLMSATVHFWEAFMNFWFGERTHATKIRDFAMLIPVDKPLYRDNSITFKEALQLEADDAAELERAKLGESGKIVHDSEDRAKLARLGHSFADVQFLVHKMALDKGWWEKDRSDAECIALIHSELSEALDWLRKPNAMQPNGNFEPPHSDHIPVHLGVEEELADVVIRIMDLAGKRGWDIGAAIHAKFLFNATRPHKHGKKF